MFISTSFSGSSEKYNKYTLIEFNTEWNQHNNINRTFLNGIQIKRALVEDQDKRWRESVKAVPLLYLYKGSRVIKVWRAGISFRLNVSDNDIKEAILHNE